MKTIRTFVRRKFHCIPKILFEEQTLSSYAGLVVYQKFFHQISMKHHLRRCFRHLPGKPVFGAAIIFLQLMTHVLLGYRSLRQQVFYESDPMVKRVLGVNSLPDVATVSRTLSNLDEASILNLRDLLRRRVLDGLVSLQCRRITLDFDGSVIGTGKQAEGSAVGFNRKKKGQRSYYPLFCTIAQIGQVFDVLHRPGNVHDSNGAKAFILACIDQIRQCFPDTLIELRMDAAFFSDSIVSVLDELENVEYSISVPFARFAELKGLVEQRKRWRSIDTTFSFFEKYWSPASWDSRHRFLFIRQRVKVQNKEPLQLDLFEPLSFDFSHTVILTNKQDDVQVVLDYHHGRGSQEGLFGEMKTQNQLDYIPVKNLYGNQAYLLAVVFAHNLNRDLQMKTQKPVRGCTAKRMALWSFEKLNTQRQRVIQRAGRLLRPQGKLTLSMAANDAVQTEIMSTMQALDNVA